MEPTTNITGFRTVPESPDPVSGRPDRLSVLKARLSEGRTILADGSTGSVLENLAPRLGAHLPLAAILDPGVVESLHRSYFEAGSELVETATFQANARALEGLLRPGEGAHDVAYRVNLEAARAARRAADAAEAAAGGAPRWVAGSLGPGDEPPSLGAVSWASLVDSYLPQARGLADGGCDLAYVETCQDPLQIKAALAALADPDGGRGLPFVVSATVEAGGRLLAGSSIAAFVSIVAPFRPLALGLNCSGGPFELGAVLEELASLSPFPLSFMPNAGLPREVEGRAVWPLAPESFAEEAARLAQLHGVGLLGGCCGTGPAHIAALARSLATARGRAGGELAQGRGGPRPAPAPALASLYESRPIGPDLFRIGERANAAGSAAFAALVDSGDFDGAAAKAVEQENARAPGSAGSESASGPRGAIGPRGADALDIHAARRGRDEAADLEAIVARLAALAQVPLSLDSGDPEVLERVLPLVGGRPLINSASLEDEAKARKVFRLARLHGAAVICLALDADGPAATRADKVRVCRALYELATGEFGLDPASLFFDPLTFTVAAGPQGSAAETLAALPLVKEACPGSFTVLGVGNISYGLPKSLRPAVTAVFLALARERGLDAAIVDCGIPQAGSLEPELRRAIEALLLGTAYEKGEPMSFILEAAEALKASKAPASNAAMLAGAAAENLAPSGELAQAVLRGDARAAAITAREALVVYSPSCSDPGEALAEAVAGAMAEAGRRWNEGRLPLPLVLRSAEAARAALGILKERGSGTKKGTIVLATVKGDLHDIGKNIAGAIIACSGWELIDLGMDVGADAIVEAAAETHAAAVGLSGLLTRSLAEMRKTCEALAARGLPVLVLAGGAAVDEGFASRVLEPLLPGRVKACADAFEGLAFLERSAAHGSSAIEPIRKAPHSLPHKGGSPIAPKDAPAVIPARLGAEPFEGLSLEALLEALDRKTLFHARWGYRREDAADAAATLDRLIEELDSTGMLAPKGLGGFFACRRVGENGLAVLDPAAPGREELFHFPVEHAAPRRCLAQYFHAESDFIGAFAVTIGPGLGEAATRLRESGRMEEYWRLHGLGSALAEAAAETVHARLGALAAGKGSRRYSFGYPACPGVEAQAPLLSLLGAERAGIDLTEGFQLRPEHSVTAIAIAREDAEYFSV